MKFLCPNCKAKYQISDEKITGRTLKMDCRRCNHPIVIRGDAVAAEAEPVRSSPERPAASAPAPARRKPSGSHVGPAPTARSSSPRTPVGSELRKGPSSSALPPKPTPLDQWHVAINDVPVGPMKREEVAQKIAAGAITGDSLSWREGFGEWRPLKDIPELAALLRKQTAAPPPPLRALGRTPPPAAVRPARPPVAPRSAPAAPRPEAPRPAPRGNVVPLTARTSAAAAAPAFDDFSQDEPTRVGAAIDLETLDEERRLADEARARREREEREAREAREAREREERQAREREEREERQAREAREREERQAREAREREERAKPAATIADEDAFDPFASAPAPSSPSLAPTPALAVPASAPHASDDRRRGLPVGAWIAIAGAMAFGATLAVMVGIKLFQEPTPVTMAPAPAIEPTPPPVPAQPEQVEPSEPTEPTAEAAEPAAETGPEAVGAAGSEASGEAGSTETAPEAPPTGPAQPARTGSSPRTAPGTGGQTAAATTPRPSSAAGSDLNAEDAARLAQFAQESNRGSTLAVRERTNLLGEDRTRATQELNADQIRTVVNRERNSVTRCYETAARRTGQSPRVRIDVDVTISGSGTVTSAIARGQAFDNLSECIEASVRRWRFPATGTTSAASLPFVFQGRE